MSALFRGSGAVTAAKNLVHRVLRPAARPPLRCLATATDTPSQDHQVPTVSNDSGAAGRASHISLAACPKRCSSRPRRHDRHGHEHQRELTPRAQRWHPAHYAARAEMPGRDSSESRTEGQINRCQRFQASDARSSLEARLMVGLGGQQVPGAAARAKLPIRVGEGLQHHQPLEGIGMLEQRCQVDRPPWRH